MVGYVGQTQPPVHQHKHTVQSSQPVLIHHVSDITFEMRRRPLHFTYIYYFMMMKMICVRYVTINTHRNEPSIWISLQRYLKIIRIVRPHELVKQRCCTCISMLTAISTANKVFGSESSKTENIFKPDGLLNISNIFIQKIQLANQSMHSCR